MTDINNKILDMIKQNKSVKEISNELKLTPKQIFNRINTIEDYGYIISRKYDTFANINYVLGNDGSYKENFFDLENKLKRIKMMVISDLHIGNIISAENDINKIYDYCTKNDINVIIICGDIVDGTFSRSEKTIKPEKQIEQFLKVYPFDKNIINLYTLGDHDVSLLKEKISFLNAMNKKRHDIASLSQINDNNKSNTLCINNQKILVSHCINKSDNNNMNDIKLHLIGHSHKSLFSILSDDNELKTPKIHIPSFSYLSRENQINIPRAIELIIYTNDDFVFESILKKDLMLYDNKMINVSNTEFSFKNIGFENKELDENDETEKMENENTDLNSDQKKYVDEFFGRNQKKLSRKQKKQLQKKKY